MARHISSQFRDEYIQAGQTYTSTNEIKGTTDGIISNKRKDLSPSDLDIPQAKIHKSNPFRRK